MPTIMYHFVGGDERLKGISLERFRAQLDFLEQTYARNEIVLTFDHGTIDHLEHAAPELEKRGLRGLFFLLTVIQEEHRLPSVDKQRRLEATCRTELARMLCAELGIAYHPDVARGYLPEFGFYSPEERYLRYLRDQHVPAEVYEGFVGKHFLEAFGDEEAFVTREYLGWDHVEQLHRRGHVIGSHSHDHYGDKKDFARSLQAIEGRIHERPRHVSYPNGVKRISDEDLRGLGIETAYLSSEKGAGPYRAARIDCSGGCAASGPPSRSNDHPVVE